jgi:pilus assembly protein Flp/PilA
MEELMMWQIRKFVADESGATAVEYGIIVALIAGAIIVTVQMLGTSLNQLFGVVADTVSGAAGST